MAKKNLKQKKSRITKKSKQIPFEVTPVATDVELVPNIEEPVQTVKSKKNSLLGAIVIGILLIGVLLVRKGYIVSALVDGKPIFSWRLNQILNQRYGQQTLETLITEVLIANAAQKNGVKVSTDDIKTRQDEILANIGEDIKLEELLKYQGLTRADFENQLKTQITIEKILSKDLQITDQEIDNYIATNSSRMQATDAAALRTEAKKAIVEIEIGKRIQGWFTELKNKASIVRF